ncbi:threonine--tRNA ligase 2, cytoplasmic [Homo sapiens]|uniref:Threonine--tRNA ligase 2, cytoplasmic n=2 Tax=Homo sapiens TaxID=9606 RepID=SYTC2_HUMAN|nr:threonine--tRNA ligase 2, cytoplasmic [Homo sapiens]A2RTX5.1 RecName: Full=Threonine--tRNA ligase 2, cytoplasmic; AltName: Full=Threonyl-tRNA synthetase; Short=ThrRS; AltName: Full=Threonyl-tRNA synthetase protein 3 [Homo sapiens]AAI32672.1 Threonyl-tRNA synthetase-like 2 [Homo sapiens]AAI36316.1 Threonyl-tRNA synthetase-like 2 [Homo sapiens]EAX02316.1 threonyl-tRNA synthetase-like 2 [Homo sapiens]KAI2576054.1 threonyl-tRNA synthetase 3 [Homo sapiens]|eukprot:NP_689547.2 threonine--tRNA ligase 2, cytoplasmic [Homo sapiens]
MAAEALAAEAVASRLERQEEDIRWLWSEVERLRDEQLNAPYSCQAEGPCLTREVAQLRAENCDLRHRLCSLRLCLAEERSRQATLESAELEAAQEAGAQPPPSQSQDKDMKKKKMKESEADSEVKHQPIFIKERLKLFEILKKDHQLLLAIYGKKGDTSNIITVRVADGQTVQGEVWKTTPYQVAAEISQELAESTVIAKVNGELWDLDRPLEGDSSLELLTFDNEEAQAVYWHSSAHILGEAMELYYGGHLCYGPPIENGFYYDMFIEDRAVSSTELSALENICKAIIKEKQPFERLEVSKEILLEMFKYNKFKCRILNEKVNTATTTVYRCGPLIDLCKGPHVRHTGKIKTIKIFKNSSTYWEGNPEMETLQRIYGISFPDNKMMRDWEKFQEEAKNRDHRKIGKEQELFFFHDLSPGSCFFLPRGAFIYNTLTDFIREEYHKRDFTEVLSPNMYNSKLWEASGHWQHYSENMFTFEIEKDTFALKPMNCPGHCLMFAHRPRSWREMPIRFADFGVLHRNELSGTLSGLTRVRRFQQDDAHIFCTVEQIEEEIKGCLQFLQSVYSTFGFSFQLNLSTRPENFLGEIEMWNEAEKQLQNSLMDFGEPWKMNPGDGAFYGPKIDIKIKDAIGRYHQCATIQLDFQLPIRFNLTYVSKDGDDKKRPVIIHRAILGSVERMIAILSENYGGKWPFWLSPRQVMVIPVGPTCEKYALQVSSEFFEEGFMADVDLDHSCTLNKKIRNAQLAQYNFILVVGEKEKIDNAVNVRTRDNKIHGEILVTSAIDKLKNLRKTRTLNAEEAF